LGLLFGLVSSIVGICCSFGLECGNRFIKAHAACGPGIWINFIHSVILPSTDWADVMAAFVLELVFAADRAVVWSGGGLVFLPPIVIWVVFQLCFIPGPIFVESLGIVTFSQIWILSLIKIINPATAKAKHQTLIVFR